MSDHDPEGDDDFLYRSAPCTSEVTPWPYDKIREITSRAEEAEAKLAAARTLLVELRSKWLSEEAAANLGLLAAILDPPVSPQRQEERKP
jgi:hypothetical protein